MLCRLLVVTACSGIVQSACRLVCLPAAAMLNRHTHTSCCIGVAHSTAAAHLVVQELHARLGLFIPLIVVNCIILGRAEAFASKNSLLLSLFDGLGMGLGFTLALTILGSVREIHT